MPVPLYDVLLVAHLVTAVVGFGAIGVAGLSAWSGRRSASPVGEERLLRYFREGPDVAGRLIFLVPVLGLAMLFGGDRHEISSLWPWAGLAAFLVAAGLATAIAWPAERRAQKALAAAVSGGGNAERVDDFRAACLKMERAIAGIEVCFVVALGVMIAQPR
ncbi:MAG: hypothetical protein ACRDZP_07140 [Acidimicrobiales bacterium]